MITIDVFRDADGRVRGFRSAGHAEYGEYGQDIVCAAVSAVTQTTVLGLMRHLRMPVKVKQSSGHLECMLGDDASAAGVGAQADAGAQANDSAQADTGAQTYAGAQVLLESMVLGLSEVVRQYPEHVRLRSVKTASHDGTVVR